MRRMVGTLLAVCLIAVACLGCGSDVTPGVNKDKDKPRPADQPSEKR